MKPVPLIVTIFLSIIALMHLVRLIFRVEVVLAGSVMPLWTSLFGFLVASGLAVMLWRESRKTKP